MFPLRVFSGCIGLSFVVGFSKLVAASQPGIVPLQAYDRSAVTQAWGVSRDGAVAVGGGYPLPSTIETHAHRWTSTGGQNLGLLGPNANGASVAYGTNGDGSVVVGASTTGLFSNYSGFYWTAAGGMQNMGTFAPVGSGEMFARFVSADGGIVAGYGDQSSSSSRVFRWTPGGGYQDLGTPHGVTEKVYVAGMSAAGSALTGYTTSGATARVFQWTDSGGYQDLPLLPGALSDSCRGMSADGSTIVGFEVVAGGNTRAFTWSESKGKQLLFTPAGGVSGAGAVSADGAVIAGSYYTSATGSRLALWLPDQGMIDLFDMLNAQGVSTNGWTSMNITGISDDGSTIVGYGRYNDDGFVLGDHGFLITIPSPGGGLLLAGAAYSFAAVRRRRHPATSRR